MCEDDQGERIAAACVIAQLGRESEIDEYKRRFRCEGRPSFFLSWRNWSTLRSTFPSFTHASAKRMNSHRGYWKVSCYGRHRDSLGPTKLGILLGILRDFSLSLRVYVFASHGSLKIIRRENDGSKKKQNVSDEKKERKEKKKGKDFVSIQFIFGWDCGAEIGRPSRVTTHAYGKRLQTAASRQQIMHLNSKACAYRVRKWTFFWIHRRSGSTSSIIHPRFRIVGYFLVKAIQLDSLCRFYRHPSLVLSFESVCYFEESILFNAPSFFFLYSIQTGGGVGSVCRQRPAEDISWLITFLLAVNVKVLHYYNNNKGPLLADALVTIH